MTTQKLTAQQRLTEVMRNLKPDKKAAYAIITGRITSYEEITRVSKANNEYQLIKCLITLPDQEDTKISIETTNPHNGIAEELDREGMNVRVVCQVVSRHWSGEHGGGRWFTSLFPLHVIPEDGQENYINPKIDDMEGSGREPDVRTETNSDW